jgi:glycosyltransferase involved in cell wall biosynthesis
LARHGRDYDVVLTGSFPYFPLLTAVAARRRGGYEIVVDWPEVWTRHYWDEYLGALGAFGWWVQRRCIRVRQRAICPSQLTARRLRENGAHAAATVYRGLFDRHAANMRAPVAAEPIVVFAGRHIPEKRITALVPTIARAREAVPDLRCTIFGDGPEREELLRLIVDQGLGDVIQAPGFVSEDKVESTLARALCLVLPSRREGYGLVVVEAAARGVPSIVVAGSDNAATELIEEGVNGFVAPTASAEDLAAAIIRVHDAGEALRASTAAWFRDHADELSLDASIATVARLLERPGRND